MDTDRSTTDSDHPLPPLPEFLRDVLVTAVEGGINYWAGIEAYDHCHGSDRPASDAYAVVYEAEYDPAPQRIGIDDLRDGVDLILKPDFEISKQLRADIAADYAARDMRRMDAAAADAVVQAAIFGEVVFG